MKMGGKRVSWGIVILLFVLFFPVGIWLLASKMTREKGRERENGKGLKWFGWTLVALAAVYIIMGLCGELTVEPGESLVGGLVLMTVLLGGGGAFMIWKGKDYMARGAMYARYAAIARAQPDGSIYRIAEAYPARYDQAVHVLKQMVEDGYFPGGYLDETRRELVLPGHSPVSGQGKPKRVTCPNCGAHQTLESGGADSCEYCGSPLE